MARVERYYPWLAATAFLAPLLGGQISLDPQPLAPGGMLGAIYSEPSGAILAHFLLFLPLAMGFLLALGRRAVLQVPHVRISVLWIVFGLSLTFGVLSSSYRYVSAHTFAEWIAYLLAFFAVVSLSGRTAGPRWIAGAFAAGCSLIALMSIREYMLQVDPNWRVIANWTNPNALAALMAMGVFCGLGCAVRSGEPGERNRYLPTVMQFGASICVTALTLTQSKGALLAVGVAGVVFALASWLWRPITGQPALARMEGPLRTGMAFFLGLIVAVLLQGFHVQSHSSTSPPVGFSRLSNAGATSEQSAGFRKLLWQTSIDLIKENPMGHGLGTFRHQSAKPGRVTQTQLAHQSYLQLGAEAGVVSLALFIAALLASAWEVLRGAKSAPSASAGLRAGLLAALVALGVHSAIDSDFSFFGLGLTFFMLLGALFQLSNDASAPEFTPKPFRAIAGFLTALTAGALLYFGVLDARLGQLRYALQARDPAAAEAAFAAASSMAPGDARVWFLGSRIAGSKTELKARLEKAIALGPLLVYHRALSDFLIEEGDLAGAERQLNAALRIDRNNLLTLRRLLALKQKDDPEGADQVARLLVAVEDTTYFRTRSLPELVPTETYEARAFLARRLTGAAKANMLEPALAGYLNYARQTVPQVVMFANAGLDGSYGGVTADEAIQRLSDAEQVASELAGKPGIDDALKELAQAKASLRQ